MKKLILIALLVGSLFAQNDKLILKNGESYNVKYYKILTDGEQPTLARITIYNNNGSILSTSYALNKIESLILENGTIIINDGNLILDVINSDVKENNLNNNNINQSSRLIETSGIKLKRFKKQWATAYIMRGVGLGLIQIGATQEDNTFLIWIGGGLGFMGTIIDLLSYNRIDEAGDALIEASKELEKEQSK